MKGIDCKNVQNLIGAAYLDIAQDFWFRGSFPHKTSPLYVTDGRSSNFNVFLSIHSRRFNPFISVVILDEFIFVTPKQG
jgi:hypothetical protein